LFGDELNIYSFRFRPIMMTTTAALLGTLPIALGYGAGGKRGGHWVLRSSADLSSRNC